VFIKNNSFILSGAADVLFFAGFNNAHSHTHAEKHERGCRALNVLRKRGKSRVAELEVNVFVCICESVCMCARMLCVGRWPLRVVFFLLLFLSFYGE
jgi:hypothetical protein